MSPMTIMKARIGKTTMNTKYPLIGWETGVSTNFVIKASLVAPIVVSKAFLVGKSGEWVVPTI